MIVMITAVIIIIIIMEEMWIYVDLTEARDDADEAKSPSVTR